MKRTAIFLGAGASRALGLPLTKDIFPMLLERLRNERQGFEPLFGGDAIDQERLRRCLEAILPGLQEFAAGAENRQGRRETLPPITDILSTIDYLLLSSNAPGSAFTMSELTRARILLERAIFELLVRNESPDGLRMQGIPEVVREEWRQTAELRLLPERTPDYEIELGRMVDWIVDLASKPGDCVALISTNYDIEVEQELYTRLGYDVFDRVDFGMSVRDPVEGTVRGRPDNARFAVYKLHGSLNWLRCDLCENVYVNPVGAIAYLSFLLGDDAERHKRDKPWLEQRETHGANRCHCGYQPLRHVIVAPSFVRDVRDPTLLGIWRNALEALRQADDWIIIGYSLPPEDVAIRSMLLRAYQGRDSATQPRIVAVQQDRREPELTRYQLLLPKHTYVQGGLTEFLNSLDRGAR